MIPNEMRQCPKVDSKPVGVKEVCYKCQWYDPDPRTLWHCRYIIHNVDADRYLARIREILGGEG